MSTAASTPRRRGATPDHDVLAAPRPPRLTKAPTIDPVAPATTRLDANVETSSGRTPGRGRAPGKTTRAEKVKFGFYTDPDLADRARAAYANLPADERPLSLSDFLSAALRAHVERAEQRHNNGHPWTPAPAGSIGTGRPASR